MNLRGIDTESTYWVPGSWWILNNYGSPHLPQGTWWFPVPCSQAQALYLKGNGPGCSCGMWYLARPWCPGHAAAPHPGQLLLWLNFSHLGCTAFLLLPYLPKSCLRPSLPLVCLYPRIWPGLAPVGLQHTCSLSGQWHDPPAKAFPGRHCSHSLRPARPWVSCGLRRVGLLRQLPPRLLPIQNELWWDCSATGWVATWCLRKSVAPFPFSVSPWPQSQATFPCLWPGWNVCQK